MSRIAPYEEQHKMENIKAKDTRPTALQIIQDQDQVGKWAGRVVLVTGCSPGGLGPETARAMHVAGADVYITVRDVAKGEEVREDILSDGKPGKVEVVQMDLASLESVKAAAEDFLARSGGKLNVLINNAGVMACPEGKTKDGFERQIGTNHLGHFYLFHHLKPALLTSSTPTFHSRLISVSSSAHLNGQIDLADLNFTQRPYESWASYSQSKLANVLFANEIERRYASRGLHATSLNPGGIKTELQKYSPHIQHLMTIPEIQVWMKSVGQGAGTSVWAAVARELEGKGGFFLEDCGEAVPNPADEPELTSGGYHKSRAVDPVMARELWKVSLGLVGLEDDE